MLRYGSLVAGALVPGSFLLSWEAAVPLALLVLSLSSVVPGAAAPCRSEVSRCRREIPRFPENRDRSLAISPQEP